MLGEIFKAGDREFTVKQFLGKGKSGYSYLIEDANDRYVLKIMHDEECPYYTFGDKLKSEVEAYERLKNLIRVPRLVHYDSHKKLLVKEYIEGPTAAEAIAGKGVDEELISRMFKLSNRLKREGINIDYFPANFVIQDDEAVYVDYEYNNYMKEWDFSSWGIFYWVNASGMKKFLETNDILAINEAGDSGIPIKAPFEETVRGLMLRHGDS